MAIDDNTSYELTGYQVKDLAQKIRAKADSSSLASVATSGLYSDLTGAPSIPTVYNGTLTIQQNGTTLGTFSANQDTNETIDIVPKLVEMSYGESSAWAKFIAAYNAGSIVYCRASSNANPATGSQTRKAFMAYVNNAESPTSVEFQYVRSVSSKTASQPVDQVYVYTLTSSNGGTWSVQTRDMGPKLAAGSNASVSYSSGTYTISATNTTYSNMTGATASTAGTAGLVPAPAAGDNTKFLRGDGTWATAGGGGASIPTVYLSDNGSLFRGSFANLLFPNNGFVLSATPISYTAGSNTAISEGDMIALLQSGCPIRVEGSIAQDGYASGCTGLITCSSTGAGAKFRLEFLGSNQYFAGTASVNSIDGTTGGVRWGWQQ